MKTKLFLQLGLFTALFAACATSDDEELTSQQNQKRGMVKTEFTIAFPQNTTGVTRMSDDMVQLTAQTDLTKFRGINEIELYPFSAAAEDVKAGTTIPDRITLYGNTTGTVSPNGISGNENQIASSGALYTGSRSHLYQNVDIPIATKSFIFYGVAAGTDPAWEQGALTKVTADEATTLAGITFKPNSIFTGTSVGSNGTTIAEYMTAIAKTTTGTGVGAKAWKDTPNVGLRALYNNFISIKTGAWANVKAAVQKMYTNLEPKDGDNAETQAMKAAIRASIAPADGTANSYGVSQSGGTLSFAKDYDNYPADLHLPDGAAYLSWSVSGEKFDALTTNENTGMNTTPLSNFVHPASLYYFVKSDIKTSQKTKASYDNNDTWATITSDTNYEEGTEVTSKTRSIVIKDAVQYAVGRLDVKVKAAASVKDHADNVISLTKTVGETETNCFPITGVLIGGQKAVDFEFHQVSDADATKYTIYDSQVDDGGTRYLSSTQTTAIHTLVLETAAYTSDDDANAKVPIAIEFQNNSGEVFTGYQGEYIFPGCKFYLIGTLNPYKSEADTYKKAFMQDFTTTAELNIQSLANAHSTLPDMSVPSLELGLSIDMTWNPGVTYEVTIQ